VPNGGKDFAAKMRFLENIETWAAEAQAAGRGLLLCGDLNVARSDMDIHPKERKPNQVGARPDERRVFEQILSHDLVDVGRAMEPTNENLFTWWAPWRNLRQRNIGWRIDYVLATTSLASKVRRIAVQREFGTSDHGPVVADFDL
jgi:exodeoxyribonuclease-3